MVWSSRARWARDEDDPLVVLVRARHDRGHPERVERGDLVGDGANSASSPLRDRSTFTRKRATPGTSYEKSTWPNLVNRSRRVSERISPMIERACSNVKRLVRKLLDLAVDPEDGGRARHDMKVARLELDGLLRNWSMTGIRYFLMGDRAMRGSPGPLAVPAVRRRPVPAGAPAAATGP